LTGRLEFSFAGQYRMVARQDKNAQRPETLQRIGLLAIDPLRTLGLETILSAKPNVEVVALSTGNLDLAGFSLLVIDRGCTEHFFELLAGFRRKYPRLKVIVLGMDGDYGYIQRVIGAGAKGYLTHFAKDAEIQMAIEIVLDGSVWAPRKVLANLLEAAATTGTDGGTDQPLKITEREQQVLRLLVAGRPNREIGRSLGIDEGTVKAHVGRLMRKVGVENRIALTMLAVERKLVIEEPLDS
jgi:DNA-binding NarL/FixJ family response regulator